MSLKAISIQLSDQNKELMSQGDVMKENNTQLETLNRNFSNFLIKLESNETDELETQAEERLEKSRERQTAAKPKGQGGSLFGSAENTLMGLGIPGMGVILGKGLLGGLVRGGLAFIMAEAVADYIKSQGFSEEVSNAVGRGLTGYGILRVFGKRLGAIGLIGGFLATPENIEATKTRLTELTESFKIGYEKFSVWFEQVFGQLLPTTDEIIAKINNIVGDSFTGLNALLRGEFNSEEFYGNLGSMAATFTTLALLLKPRGTLTLLAKAVGKLGGAALALSGLSGAAAGLVPPTATTGGAAAASTTTLNSGQLQQQAGKLTNKQLSAAGLEKNKAGRIIDSKTKKFATAERLNSTVTSANTATKFPRVAKFLRAPGVGYILGAYDVYSILNSPGSMESKIAPLAGVLSAVLGSGGGAMLGAALGSVFPGPGTLIGGALGGILGWVGAEAVGKGLAQFMLGQKVDSFGYGFGWVNDMLNGIGAPTPSMAPGPNSSTGYEDPIMGMGAASVPSQSANALGNAMTYTGDPGMQAAGGATVIGGDSYNIVGGSDTTVVGGGMIGTTDTPVFSRY